MTGALCQWMGIQLVSKDRGRASKLLKKRERDCGHEKAL